MSSWFLSSIQPGASLLGVLTLAAGIGLLFLAWRQSKRHWPSVGAGWLCITLAYWPWMAAAGFDRGAALASLIPGLLALLLIGLRTPWGEWNPGRERPVAANRGLGFSWPWLGQVALQVLVTGALSLLASLGAALLLFAALDTSIANKTVAAALLVMLLWPALMVWSRASSSLLKPALCFIGLGGLGLLAGPLLV